MFTGLIKDVGNVVAVKANALDRELTLSTKLDMTAQALGASVACNGVCLTLISKAAHEFTVMVSAETLAKTTIGAWKEGTRVNLEPSLKMGDELGGHFVYGHVDGLSRCLERKKDGTSWRLTFETPHALKGFIAPKGSVALDGISLTVNEVGANSFGVNIIPHTMENTHFSDLAAGQQVNMEIDMLARYVARYADCLREEGKAA